MRNRGAVEEKAFGCVLCVFVCLDEVVQPSFKLLFLLFTSFPFVCAFHFAPLVQGVTVGAICDAESPRRISFFMQPEMVY